MDIEDAQACFLEMRLSLVDSDHLIDGEYTSRLVDLYIDYFTECEKSEVLQVIASFEDEEEKKLPPIIDFDNRLRSKFPKDAPAQIPRHIASSKRAALKGLADARAKLAQLKEASA